VGPKAAGKENNRIRFLNKDQLAGKEEIKSDQLRILFDNAVGFLAEGELDIQAEAPFFSRTFVPRLHNARAGSGDDHETLLGEATSHVRSQLIVGALFPDPGGAEDAHLANPTVGGENLEGISELLEGSVENLEISPARFISDELQDGLHHLGSEVIIRCPAASLNPCLDLFFKRGGRHGPSFPSHCLHSNLFVTG
jgi:hypothetical protein